MDQCVWLRSVQEDCLAERTVEIRPDVERPRVAVDLGWLSNRRRVVGQEVRVDVVRFVLRGRLDPEGAVRRGQVTGMTSSPA
ncbi:hypothetical protein [Haloarchaeobius sp. HRN-SO-5]|uniref:hypothetical protein n=1 Tax=Haloarchaeobius sp. HRN-SO-5 TaxID=3446118 RepID=UPI003EBC2854